MESRVVSLEQCEVRASDFLDQPTAQSETLPTIAAAGELLDRLEARGARDLKLSVGDDDQFVVAWTE